MRSQATLTALALALVSSVCAFWRMLADGRWPS